MKASGWSSGNGTFGIRVGTSNRDRHFDPSWREIEVEIDGHSHRFTLTPGFWNKCPEFRDSGGTAIKDWLSTHYTIDWLTGKPPQFQLTPVGVAKFRLVAKERDVRGS